MRRTSLLLPPPPPQKQTPARARRESGTPRTKTTRTTMKTMIKQKPSWERASTEFPFSTRPRPPPSYSLHRICNPPSRSKLFLLGQDCTGRVGQVELHCHQAPPPPWNREPPNNPPPPHPTRPEVLRRPSTQHSTISLLTPSLCISCEDFGTGI